MVTFYNDTDLKTKNLKKFKSLFPSNLEKWANTKFIQIIQKIKTKCEALKIKGTCPPDCRQIWRGINYTLDRNK